MAIARRLAKSGLGRELCNAMTDLSAEAFTVFLHGWRNQLRNELAEDPHHLLGRRHRQLARQVQDDFPRLDILRQYALPITSGSLGNTPKLQEMSRSWVPHGPDLGGLAGICQALFGWGLEVNICDKFERHVWPGAILRSLLQVCPLIHSKLLLRVLTANCKGSDIGLLMQAHVNEGVVRGPPPPSSALVQIITRKNGTGLMHGIHLLRFRATTHGLYQALLPVLSKTHGSHSGARRATLLLSLPEPIVNQALPEMVAAYHASLNRAPRRATGSNTVHVGPTYIDLTDDSDTLDNGSSNMIDLTVV